MKYDKDDFLKDDAGRYEYKTLFYYDGPQLWVRFDTVLNEQRLFINMDTDQAYSGIITDRQLERLEANKLKMRDCWERLTNYRQHVYEWGGEDEGQELSVGEAIESQPMGDCYLGH